MNWAAFWDKLKVMCGRSLTIASGYVSLVAGEVLANLDGVAQVLGDPSLHDDIQSLIGHDPSVAAWYARLYGGLMIATRLRSKLVKPAV